MTEGIGSLRFDPVRQDEALAFEQTQPVSQCDLRDEPLDDMLAKDPPAYRGHLQHTSSPGRESIQPRFEQFVDRCGHPRRGAVSRCDEAVDFDQHVSGAQPVHDFLDEVGVAAASTQDRLRQRLGDRRPKDRLHECACTISRQGIDIDHFGRPRGACARSTCRYE